jgi:hypothetical protein
MRISSQNNQFLFNLPENFISDRLEKQFQELMDKKFIPYNTIMDYINSGIKDIVFPSLSYQTVEQSLYHGKIVSWRESGNIMDKFQNELDVTFRSFDSHLNYFIILQIINDYYLNNENYLDVLNINVLDKDGDILYTVLLKEIIYKSLSELRMSYNSTEYSEQTFTLTFKYNFIDVIWQIGDQDGTSIFDTGLDYVDGRNVSKLESSYIERKTSKNNF